MERFDVGVVGGLARPGKPVENCFIESFNGNFRDECLNEHWFASLAGDRSTRRDHITVPAPPGASDVPLLSTRETHPLAVDDTPAPGRHTEPVVRSRTKVQDPRRGRS